MAELLAPDGMTLAVAGEALDALPAVADGEVREIEQTFYDTFDGLLHAEGLSLVLEDGRFRLVDRASGEERATAPALDGLPLREVCGVRAVLPLVAVHSRVRRFRVLDEEQKTVVRIALAEPEVASGAVLRPRARVVAVRGYAKQLARVCAALQEGLGFQAADEPLVDEAARAAGRAPAGISAKVEVALAVDQRADEATAEVLQRLLEVMEANLPGAIDDLDPEFLHDFRVSVRRSRAVQRECRTVFPPGPLGSFRTEFRWLQQATGDARDLDVYVLEFDEYRRLVPEAMRRDLDPVLEVLRRRRARAHEEMVRALRSRRSSRLLAQWRSFLDELPSLGVEDRPDALTPIGSLAGERIGRVYRRMVRMGGAIDGGSPAGDYHELRKKGKELRYLLELFGKPLHPGEVVGPMVKALKALQDVLGRHQDREVQTAMLRSLRDEVAAARDGAAALMAMGVLVERLGEDERAARREFAERFAAFASPAQRRLMKDTFA